jgi:hypothetical protein
MMPLSSEPVDTPPSRAWDGIALAFFAEKGSLGAPP